MLASDTDDAFVVLVRNMKGDGSRHFLFDEVKTVLHGFILPTANVNVEVVLVETVKDDLDIAWRDNQYRLRAEIAHNTYFDP